MHTNQTYNYLTIENPEKLPFPSDIKENLKDVEWDKIIWNTFGLPAFHSTFCLSGDELYFEKGIDNSLKLHKEEFTGQILVSGIVIPKESEEIFLVTFELHFCNGTLSKSELKELKKQSRVEYEAGFKEFQISMRRTERIMKSWWFRWLYKPYFYIINSIVYAVVWIVEFILKLFIWVAGLLLPIKL